MKPSLIKTILTLGGASAVMGLLIVMLRPSGDSLQIFTNGLQQGQAAEGEGAIAASTSSNDGPVPQLERSLVQRNTEMETALTLLRGDLENTICARTAYYVDMAQRHHQESGGSVERFLLDRIQGQTLEAQQKTIALGGFNGSAQHQQESRAIVIDQMAALKALQSFYKGEADKTCLTNPLPSLAAASNFYLSAQTHLAQQERELQRQIEQQQIARQAEGGSDAKE